MTTKEIFGAYPFRIGNNEAWALHDGSILGEPVQQYAIDASDDEIADVFAPFFLNPQRIQLSMTPILIRWGTDLVLTDTGIGSVLGDPVGGLCAPSLLPRPLRLDYFSVRLGFGC